MSITIIVSLITGIIIYSVTRSTALKRFAAEVELSTNDAVSNMDTILEESRDQLVTVVSNVYSINSKEMGRDATYEDKNTEIRKELYAALLGISTLNKRRFYFYDMNGAMVYTVFSSTERAPLFDTWKELADYSSSNVHFMVGSLKTRSNGNKYIRFVNKMRASGALSDIRYAAFDFDPSILDPYYLGVNRKYDAFSCVIDSYGTVVSSDTENLNGSRFDALFQETYQNGDPVRVNGKEYYAYARKVGFEDWSYVICVPFEYVNRDMAWVFVVLLIEPLLFILLSILIMVFIRKQFTKPIKMLTADVVASEPPYRKMTFNAKYDDEIGKLAKAFKDKNRQIEEYIESIKEMEHKYLKAQTSAYSSQLNPHMLYNTMATAIWLAEKKRNEDVITTIKNLSDIMRVAMGRNKDMVTVFDEIELVKKYLEILEYRYPEKFKCLYMLPGRIMNCQIPNITLQPVVENAIYHGIKLLDGPGMLIIRGIEEKEDVVIQVYDNGPASKETIEELNRNVQESDFSGKGLGIKNVHIRLQYVYGSEYGISYRKEDDYTVCSIRIKKIPASISADENL